MATEPILSLGDIEPDRPTVAINRSVPDGAWQAIKARYFDVLLRWSPVRTVQRRDLYELRRPNELGLKTIARIQSLQRTLRDLGSSTDDASTRRVSEVLREITGMILMAPPKVLDSLTDDQHMKLLAVFPKAAVSPAPPPRPKRARRSISGAPSPVSAVSTARTTG